MTNKQTGKIESCRNYKNAQWLAQCERSGKSYSGRQGARAVFTSPERNGDNRMLNDCQNYPKRGFRPVLVKTGHRMPDNLPGCTWDGDPAAPWNASEPVCGTCDYWFDVDGGICIYPAVEEDRIEIEPHPATDPDCGFWRPGWE